MNVLFAWVGHTDLRYMREKELSGPIIGVLLEWPERFDRVVLISTDKSQCSSFKAFVSENTKIQVDMHYRPLADPTDFGKILSIVDVLVAGFLEEEPKAKLSFHLSPGTVSMAISWVLLASARYSATLITTAKETGAREQTLEFLHSYLGKTDLELERLAQGRAPLNAAFHDIVHQGEAMRRLIAKAEKVARRNVPVLLDGESGTGKELFASAIHNASLRHNKPLVRINCGSIPTELIESELFGHIKGSFTGAHKDRVGYFEQAHEGTLFLDEVGELAWPAQVRLLRALNEGEISRVGESRTRKIDVRIISATNRNLLTEVREGRFRLDLFYRLAVARLSLPPLRERMEDLEPLIEKLLEKVNEDFKVDPMFKKVHLDKEARKLLHEHAWPGNVRELWNTLRAAATWADGHRIGPNDIREGMLPDLQNEDEQILNQPLHQDFNLENLLDQVSRHYLERALQQSGGVKRKAAALLGFSSHQTLGNWLERLGVEGQSN